VKDEIDRLFYLAAGPIAAIFLGAALVLVRDWTTASNFSFIFLALIIAVAEFGGRAAALTTAVASALSLDFFLTQPYLRLSISEKGDIIACAGLAGCGLLAAVLSDRRPGSDALREVSILRTVLEALTEPGPLEKRLGKATRRCCNLLPLAAIVVRDSNDHVIGSSAGPEIARPVPSRVLPERALAEPNAPKASEPLPRDGARIALIAGDRRLGWLDFWGDGTPAEMAHQRALTDAAGALALALGGSGVDLH
jgi:hypothetical protein